MDAGPDTSVLVEAFLEHLNLDVGTVKAVLRRAYPCPDRVPGPKRDVRARVRFIAWMTIPGFTQLAPAIRAAQAEPEAMRMLGFAQGAPPTRRCGSSSTIASRRGALQRLKMALVREEKRRLCPKPSYMGSI
jgi:hypothetical protein